MKKLKRCPICKSKKYTKVWDDSEDGYSNYTVVCDSTEDGDSNYSVVCDSTKGGCGCCGGYDRTPEKARANWNKRGTRWDS
jgi:hypothetical protein